MVHPDITRYFMTIPEACQLVIQAGAIGERGQVLVLNMGEPVRILDMAKRLIRDSGKDIEVRITGLREGEKLHEVLFSGAEKSTPSQHPLISSVWVEPRDPAEAMTRKISKASDLNDCAPKDATHSRAVEIPL